MTAAGAQWNYKAEEEDDSMKVGPGESMRREDRFRVSCHTWNLALAYIESWIAWKQKRVREEEDDDRHYWGRKKGGEQRVNISRVQQYM